MRGNNNTRFEALNSLSALVPLRKQESANSTLNERFATGGPVIPIVGF